MASQDYYRWDAAGRPWSVARPVNAIAGTLRGYGYTVYTIGDESHLTADPPEDHTPYSHTGWPDTSPEWWVHAFDVMPPESGSGLPSLAQLGQQMFDDRLAERAGARCIKYMNWEPKGPGGPCYHDSWQPSHKRTTSTDRGHLHVSIRSDYTHSAASDDYDPVRELMPLSGNEIDAIAERTLEVFLQKNLSIPADWMAAFPADPGIQDGTIGIDTLWRSGYFHARQVNEAVAAALAAGFPATLTPEQLSQLAAEVRAGVVEDLRALVFRAEP